MTYAQALESANVLRVALLDNGVRRVSVELQQGVAGSGWGVAPFRRGMGHHIASRPSQGLTPGLALVKRGRTGASPLSGPLCNGYGGFDLTARIITLAWANHPGAGGPWSVPGWGTVPRDNGRPYAFGWEFEGGYEPYTDEMHEFMARCGAGTLDWLGTLPGTPGPAPLSCWDEHKGWAGPRKPDRIGYTTASGRARIAAVRGTATPTVTDRGDPAMRVLRTPDGSIWLATDLEVTPTGNAGLSGSAQKAWGSFVDLTREEVAELEQDAERRRARLFPAPAESVLEVEGGPAVNAAELAAALAGNEAFVGSLARALRVELDRAARDGDASTGPVT